jgi:hypothetical protein
MTPDIERLLGGYATNTLTEAERKLLYDAALEDQHLFNALEDEQALRDLLADDESRREIVRALRPQPKKPARLWIWGLSAGVAAVAVLVLVLVPRNAPKPKLAVALSAPTPALETAIPAPHASPAPARKTKDAKAPPPNQTIQVEVQADAIAQLGGAPVRARAVSGNQFLPAAGLAKKELLTAAFLILRTQSDDTSAELAPSETVPANSSIIVKLRPGLPGSLTVSEFSNDGTWKALPPDAPILVDRHKLIRLEWQNSSTTNPLTSLLVLTPDKPATITQQP